MLYVGRHLKVELIALMLRRLIGYEFLSILFEVGVEIDPSDILFVLVQFTPCSLHNMMSY
jgi:hypothetical protein